MNEAEIVATLRENVPDPNKPDSEPIEQPKPGPTGANDATLNYDLDEITLYKLHNFFGEQYKSPDEESSQQLSYIFGRVAEDIGTRDYGFIVARVHEIERILGIANDERRLYKLYQWLKLDNVRRSAEAQMGSLQP